MLTLPLSPEEETKLEMVKSLLNAQEDAMRLCIASMNFMLAEELALPEDDGFADIRLAHATMRRLNTLTAEWLSARYPAEVLQFQDVDPFTGQPTPPAPADSEVPRGN